MKATKNALFLLMILMFTIFSYRPVWAVLGFDIAQAEEEKQVPILMYHFLATDNKKPNKWKILVNEFESDLKALKEGGFEAIFIQDLIDFVYSGAPLPEKPVILSFDDGASDFYVHAYPLLKEYDMKAVMAIIGSQTDKYSEDTEQNKYAVPNLTWEQLREMKSSGLVEIQSHSYNMHRDRGIARKKGESARAYRERISTDAAKFSERVLEELGCTPTAFIFPFGAKSEESNDILKENGFMASLICHEVISTVKVGDPDTLFDLGRILRPSGVPSGRILERISVL